VSTTALSYSKRRWTLDRWKASTIIRKSDRRTFGYPVHNREQLNYNPEHYTHGKSIIPHSVPAKTIRIPHGIHVPAPASTPIIYALLNRCPYQLALESSALSLQSARTRAFRHLHLTLAGRGLQLLSCRYRRPGSTSISRITRPSL
jgi:hypothetical protein